VTSSSKEPAILLIAVAAALALSAIHPYDRATWWMEVAPVLIALPILLATHRSFPLTPLLYRLLLLHALVLILGGHYTYARVPLGFWAEELFGFTRNHYDRIGHFAQGFVPAILAREVLLRRTALTTGRWLNFLIVCVCLAFSAFYELIEWWAALLGGESAEAFLGTQGDVWDTQWDMFLCLLGAVTSLVLLSRAHDRALARAPSTSVPTKGSADVP
jgi:putative membrane protein